MSRTKIDAAEAMRRRLQADLRVALKQRVSVDVAALRVLITAIDNAGAVPVAPGVVPIQSEVERRRLDFGDIEAILLREHEAYRVAASEYADLGCPVEEERARRGMIVIENYMSRSAT